MSDAHEFDLLCVGRLGVDMYGEQPGAGLASSQSFAKSVGGSAANICVGAARLGLRTAMCSRVGEEPLGRFCIDTLAANGVGVGAVQVDPERPTGLVMLALHQSDDFPRVFFYRDSADFAFDAAAFDMSVAGRCGAVLLTGSYLSRPALRSFSLGLAKTVRDAGGRVVLDIDYRPVLFGEAPLGRGQQMAGASPAVADAYHQLLPLCDLIVGTEAEILAASGESDLDAAVGMLAASATVVVKKGRLGAEAYPDGPASPGYDVEVENTVGAGDGFMSGFLSRWLTGASMSESIRAGNASGAIVASRRGCMPALPFAAELSAFLARGGIPRPDADEEIERLHRTDARPPTPAQLFVLAVDHRRQLEELASNCGAGVDRIPLLKELFAEAFLTVAAGRDDTGILLDAQYGSSALERLDGSPHPVFRAAEISGSHPVELIGGDDISSELRSWPAGQTAKVMVFLSDEEPPEMRAMQFGRVKALNTAARSLGRELLVELQTTDGRTYKPGELAGIVADLYDNGVHPEWWKLPSFRDPSEWLAIGDLVRANDPACRGLLALGAGAGAGELAAGFAACRQEPLARGFAVGRSIFAWPAAAWFTGSVSDRETINAIAAGFRQVIGLWEQAS